MAILNFGSLNLDHVYKVNHFVMPGETLASNKMETFCGGKGLNQSIALAKAGGKVYHAGKIGLEGQRLRKRLKEFNVDTRFTKDCSTPNGHAIIQVNREGQNSILLFGGSNQEITDEDINDTLNYFNSNDTILLQNEINSVDKIIKKAKENGMDIAFNPSPIGPEIKKMPLQYIRYFILNEIEGNALTEETDPKKIATSLLHQYPNSSVILTLGGKGAYYQDENNCFFEPSVSVKAVDTTGAGDTFTGYFLTFITTGHTPKESMQIASKAAAIAVSRKGASDSIPMIDEVLAFKI